MMIYGSFLRAPVVKPLITFVVDNVAIALKPCYLTNHRHLGYEVCDCDYQPQKASKE